MVSREFSCAGLIYDWLKIQNSPRKTRTSWRHPRGTWAAGRRKHCSMLCVPRGAEEANTFSWIATRTREVDCRPSGTENNHSDNHQAVVPQRYPIDISLYYRKNKNGLKQRLVVIIRRWNISANINVCSLVYWSEDCETSNLDRDMVAAKLSEFSSSSIAVFGPVTIHHFRGHW